MTEQDMFERAVALGLRAAIVVLERGEGVAGIQRLIWECEHPPRLAQADRNPEGHDPVEGHGRNDESPVLEEDAPRTNLKDNSHG